MAPSFLPDTLTAAKAWHQTPLASRMIADMHALSSIAAAYPAGVIADRFGALERDGGLFRIVGSRGWHATGLVGQLLDDLADERDAWIEAEHVRRLRTLGLSIDSDEGEDIYQDIACDADTVTFAIDAWMFDQRRLAA